MSEQVPGKEFAHEVDASRYTLRIDGEVVALVSYAVNGKSTSFNHTYTQPQLRGRGYASEIVAFAVDDVESTSTQRIVPMCWYVDKWFAEHPERAGLLAR
jgi:predicted GNAT family acetyltransferase